MTKPKTLEGVPTRVVGTTMDATRQLAVRTLFELPASKRPKLLYLVPEPENPHDPFAVRVLVDHPTLGRVQIGYVKNSEVHCLLCKSVYTTEKRTDGGGSQLPKLPADGKCARCGDSEHLERHGLAWQICRWMEEYPDTVFYGDGVTFTGGGEGKANIGVNFVIRQVCKPEDGPWERIRAYQKKGAGKK